MGLFGKSKEDKTMKELTKSVNNAWNWLKTFESWFKDTYNQLAQLKAENKAQSDYDAFSTKRLKEIDSKFSDFLTLAQKVKVLEQQVATLQSASHTHQEAT